MLTLVTFGKVELRIKSCIKSSTPELLFTTNIQIKLKIKFQIYLTISLFLIFNVSFWTSCYAASSRSCAVCFFAWRASQLRLRDSLNFAWTCAFLSYPLTFFVWYFLFRFFFRSFKCCFNSSPVSFDLGLPTLFSGYSGLTCSMSLISSIQL